MPLYRSTINLPGCPVGQAAEFPDDARTALFVSRGILRAVQPAIMDVFPEIVDTKPTLRPAPIPHPPAEIVAEEPPEAEAEDAGEPEDVPEESAPPKKTARGRQGPRS